MAEVTLLTRGTDPTIRVISRGTLMCVGTVAWMLGLIPPSCVAEESSTAHLTPDFNAFFETYFEDTEFESLRGQLDGIKESEIAVMMGFANLAFADWFKRFGNPISDS